jgi:hypothetical protein
MGDPTMADRKEDYRTNRADYVHDARGHHLNADDDRDKQAVPETRAARLRELRLARLAKDPMSSSASKGGRRRQEQ